VFRHEKYFFYRYHLGDFELDSGFVFSVGFPENLDVIQALSIGLNWVS